ncbi:hypothetical protein EVAR_52979_1 [Eumeta japonica]|uniref:Uncharacterized protein n=1 Tax=Eumeta variegata TaxID=151549 RepID=A0A4C1Z7S1_EUMVA|nr:hypothetical protein EVAR_52979_1 [Eumeta japonica]
MWKCHKQVTVVKHNTKEQCGGRGNLGARAPQLRASHLPPPYCHPLSTDVLRRMPRLCLRVPQSLKVASCARCLEIHTSQPEITLFEIMSLQWGDQNLRCLLIHLTCRWRVNPIGGGEPSEDRWSPPLIDTPDPRGVTRASLASREGAGYLMEEDRGIAFVSRGIGFVLDHERIDRLVFKSHQIKTVRSVHHAGDDGRQKPPILEIGDRTLNTSAASTSSIGGRNDFGGRQSRSVKNRI